MLRNIVPTVFDREVSRSKLVHLCRRQHREAGKITIGLCGPVTAPILPAIIRAFRRQHPDVVATVRDLAPAEQIHALLQNEIDIGFTREVPADARRLVASELLLREAFDRGFTEGACFGEERRRCY